MNILVPKERSDGETRVAAVPDTVQLLVRDGQAVTVEAGAGEAASFLDDRYASAGATIGGGDRADLWSAADLVLKVGPLTLEEVDWLRPEAAVIGLLAPHAHLPVVSRLAERKITAWTLELLPRISSAQSMDALSSQASIAGYKAAVLAAAHFGRYFPLLMTAAGTIPPARVLVLGAGVAGLQALATARRLGAVTQGADVRPAVQQEVESLGSKFVLLPSPGAATGGYAAESGPELLKKQHEVLQKPVAEADIVIGTAFVPSRPAPQLVTASMVEAMKPGSVIVDLAVEHGGNCELAKIGESRHRHVLILGCPNLPATMPIDASFLYARNQLNMVRHLLRDGKLHIDLSNEITRAALLTHQGEVMHAGTAELLKGPSA